MQRVTWRYWQKGKMSFLKYPKKEIDDYTEYGDATKYKRFEEVVQIFYFCQRRLQRDNSN